MRNFGKRFTYGEDLFLKKITPYPKFLINEKFGKRFAYGEYLFLKNRTPYFVFHYPYGLDHFIFVYSLKSGSDKNQKYEVKLSNEDSKFCMLFENQTIISYNERKHCLSEHCILPYHVYLQLNRNETDIIGDTEIMRFNERDVKRVLGCNTFNCTVNIMDNEDTPKNK
ncbi:hypothetical protein NQ314_016334 [Rhamnusium bicolor]|uniref:Uncharacterized protein n=1 Tax=Rhamnusium bicolor TaxID=1586634 RepID=A0AAV8WWN6_9CUCU|nr:hypothetical protein NQ314_016334 [Rhamnusium bicolor]